MTQTEHNNTFEDQVRDVRLKLHLLVNERLFVAKGWPPEPRMINAVLDKLGLKERVDERTLRSSRLGIAVDANLFAVWVGAWDICEVPALMEMRGLFTTEESQDLYDRMEDGEDVSDELRTLLQRTYFSYFGPKLKQ
jgi:hypothetical protein